MTQKEDEKTKQQLQKQQKMRSLKQQINKIKIMKQLKGDNTHQNRITFKQTIKNHQESNNVSNQHKITNSAITQNHSRVKQIVSCENQRAKIFSQRQNIKIQEQRKILELPHIQNQNQTQMKRPLNKLIMTNQLQLELNQIQKQSKMTKLISSDYQNHSTCIEISSSQEEQTQKKNIIKIKKQMICKVQQSIKQQINAIPVIAKNQIENPYLPINSINMLFSQIKLSYVYLSPELVVKLRKQKRRLAETKNIPNISDFKIHIQQTPISLAKTAPIRYVVQKIIAKQNIRDDIRSYKFFIFKGTMKNLKQEFFNFFSKDQIFISSEKFINLHLLYDWYSLAHILSNSSQIMIVAQKNSAHPLIEDYFDGNCQYCNKKCTQICLCLRFFICSKKAYCSSAAKAIQSHQRICRYSNPYKQLSMKQQQSHYYQRQVVGLINDQNSCFMNTALQCLAACKPLTEYFLQKQYLKNINLSNQYGTFGQIATRYAQFLNKYYTTKKSIIEIGSFKKSLCKWQNKYLLDQQQDSQQFLIHLLDWLKEDLNLNNQRPEYICTEQSENQTVQCKAQRAWNIQLMRNNSIIESLMAGMLKSQIQCSQCLYKSYNFQNFLTLPLPILKTKSSQQWSFPIKVTVVYKSFKRKNQTALIFLRNFRYSDCLNQVKNFFGLNIQSQLIGIAFQQNGDSYRISSPHDGKKQIIKAKENPNQIRLLFYEHKKQDLSQSSIEVQFALKIYQNKKYVRISCPRYLFFSKKESSSILNVFKKLLVYFYSMMFKNSTTITQQDYLKTFLNPENIPFKIWLVNQNQEIFLTDELSLSHKSQIDVLFPNEDIFSPKQLIKSLFVSKSKQYKNIEIETQKTMTIYDCFNEFQSTEIMDNQNCWNCPKCKQKRKAFKRISIYKAPQILILFFKRFATGFGEYSHRMRKLQNHVNFPSSLTLQEFVEKQDLPYTSEKKPLKYSLFAVANHFSSASNYAESGHYTAFVKKDQWFHVNDQKIQRISAKDTCSKYAYMLFYSRQNIKTQRKS